MKRLLLFALLLGVNLFTYAQSKGYGPIYLSNHTLSPTLDQNLELRFSRAEQYAGKALRIVQMPGLQLNKDYPGFRTLEYLPKNAFLVEMEVKESNAAKAFLRTGQAVVLPFQAEWKLSNNLFRQDIPEWAWLNQEQILINLRYAPGISAAAVSADLNKSGFKILAQQDGKRIIAVAARPDEAFNLAQKPYLIHLLEKEDPGTAENFNARTSHRINYLQADFNGAAGLDGNGVTVGHGDDGPLGMHLDFRGRLTQNASGSSGDHGDHVAGTIFGAGNLDPDGRGMAPGAEIYYQSYPQNLTTAQSDFNNFGVRITSSSYSNGCNAGYTNFTASMDQDAIDEPALLHVFSAGNSGNQNCNYGAGSGWGNVTGGHKIAKNVIAVANLTSTDGLASSSSRGPASDGRIKPDVGAVGTSVYSTTDLPVPNSYTFKTGTSMACPGVSGILATLYQAYRQTHNGSDPSHAGILKAVLMNTSDDLGNPGPDFRFGYGRVNARRAQQVIVNDQIIIDSINNTSSTNTHAITLPSSGTVKEVKVMLYWPDAPASTVASRALVNDLDMELNLGGNSYQPWVLDPTPNVLSLNSPAVRSRDSLNNMEQVTLLNPSGNLSIDVDAFALPAGTQQYFITYEFIMDEVTLTHPVGGEGFEPQQTQLIRWDGLSSGGSFTLEYSVDSGQNWNNIGTASAGARHYNWAVPNVATGEAMVRITQGGKSDQSPGVFTIAATPNNISFPVSCPDSATIAWDSVSGASGYVIYQLGTMYMDSIGFSSDTSFQFAQSNVTSEEWFSVSAVVDGRVGKRAVAVQKPIGLYNCALQNDLSLLNLLSPGPEVSGGCFPVNNLPVTVELSNDGSDSLSDFILSYQHNSGTIYSDTLLQSLAPGASLTYTFQDSVSLQIGYNAIDIWLTKAMDQNPYNDTLNELRNVGNGVSQSLPYLEGFDNFNQCNTATNCGATICNLKNGWQNVGNGLFDEIDWRTNSGNTPSNNTGPSVDHSLGNSSGRYLYLEASGGCDSAEAILLSPCLDLDTSFSSTIVVEFWYHMLGNDMGTLSIDLITEDSVINNVIPKIQGVNSNAWQQVTINISAYGGQQLVVRFRGKTGDGYESDIAIDDFKVFDPGVMAPVADFGIIAANHCAGDTIVFVDSSSGTTGAYLWDFGPGAVPPNANTAGPHQVVYSYGGRKNVKLTVNNAGGNDSKSSPLDIDDVSNSLFVYSLNGAKVNFSSISSNSPSSYLWDFGDGDTSSQANPSHTYAASGTYYVTLTTDNGCGSFTRGDSVSIASGVGLSENALPGLSLYPNPNKGSFKLATGSLSGSFQLVISDLGGKRLFNRELSTAGQEEISINTGSLAPGVYLVTVEAEAGRQSFRMLVEK